MELDSETTASHVAVPFINNFHSLLDPVGYYIPDWKSSQHHDCSLFIPHPPGYPDYLQENASNTFLFFSELHSYDSTSFQRHTILQPLLFVFFPKLFIFYFLFFFFFFFFFSNGRYKFIALLWVLVLKN